jgi:hypothetical protein
MTLRSHELARLLLASHDLPVYLETTSEVTEAVKIGLDTFDLGEGPVIVIVGEADEFPGVGCGVG